MSPAIDNDAQCERTSPPLNDRKKQVALRWNGKYDQY